MRLNSNEINRLKETNNPAKFAQILRINHNAQEHLMVLNAYFHKASRRTHDALFQSVIFYAITQHSQSFDNTDNAGVLIDVATDL